MASEVPRSGVVAAVSAAEPCSQKSGRTRTGVHRRLGGRAALAGERDRLGRWFGASPKRTLLTRPWAATETMIPGYT